MKYEFKCVGTDDFILEYEKNDNGITEDKEIPFRRTIEIARRIQSVNAEAREEMLSHLTKIGKTSNDFIITRVNGDGTTTYDETNYHALENSYLETTGAKIIDDITKITLGMNIEAILKELNLTKKEDVELFTKKFLTILNKAGEKEDNTFPSGNKTEQVPASISKAQEDNI